MLELERTADEFSVAAVRLVEAACSAQAGDCEAAKMHIAQALALIHSQDNRRSATGLPGAPSQQFGRPALAEWQARRLIEHIDAHLGGKVAVKDLANLLRFSTGHFCRAFKGTFGITTHAF